MSAPALPSNRRLALYLVLLAAVLPEAITGSTPPLRWLDPVQALLNVWLYGSGVLVVRELALRWRAGGAGVVLLGAAYGIVEEGLALTTFFNPALPQVASGDLGWYGRLGGVNWVWAAWLTTFHATVSTAFPILLVEWHYPALRGRRLLSDRGLAGAVASLGLVTVALLALLTALSPYRVGAAEYGFWVLAVLLLAAAARRGLGRAWLRLPAGRMPRRWAYAAGGLAFFGLTFLVYAGGPSLGGHPAVTFAEAGALVLAGLLLIRRTAGAADGDRARFAFVAGSVAFFAAFAVVLGLSGNPAFLGMPLVGVGFGAYVAWLWRKKGPARPLAATGDPAA